MHICRSVAKQMSPVDELDSHTVILGCLLVRCFLTGGVMCQLHETFAVQAALPHLHHTVVWSAMTHLCTHECGCGLVHGRPDSVTGPDHVHSRSPQHPTVCTDMRKIAAGYYKPPECRLRVTRWRSREASETAACEVTQPLVGRTR